jgi:DNA-binding response OmpR family regulator
MTPQSIDAKPSAVTKVAQPVILVVDDAPETLHMLCDALVLEGYDVLAARDTSEALERFEVTVPDGVLLDAVMPGRDGFDLCSQIKATPAWSHVPVLFMTGLSDTDEILRGFACGGVDYVIKPLRLPEIMARLATHVGNARVARLARDAVDVAGMGTVFLDSQGRIAWRSPRASEWLSQAFATNETHREDALQWMRRAQTYGEAHTDLPSGHRLVARHMGQSGPGESILLITQTKVDDGSLERLRNVALTPRETEVLSWLAKGKTNRDIADILGMSHRTVNKHLEHIYEKLGVETRSAATALANKLLA